MPTPETEAGRDERIYPCSRCGTMRSKAEGGTTFTVCDECWDATSKPKRKRKPAPARDERDALLEEADALLKSWRDDWLGYVGVLLEKTDNFRAKLAARRTDTGRGE